jgi:multiple sugar transport system ATP-binding protein
MTATVTLHDVAKRFAEKPVVEGVNLTIAPGEFIVLVGPSGCGKSTTLRMIAGLEQISAGEIAIDGRVVNGLAPKDRGVAMVFQNYALYPHLTVRDNISFGLKLARKSRAVIDEAVGTAARMLGLEELLDRRPAELSGGQRQRVAMGRAIVRQPKVFLFDEPLSNLDAKLRNSMRAEIKRLHQRLGTTVVYVTHDQVEAMTLADRIVVMRAGRIEQIGSPTELYEHPVNTFVAAFMGSPPMNLLPAVIDADLARIHFPDGQTLPLPDAQRSSVKPRQEIVVGLRPEQLSLSGEGPQLRCEVELIEALGGEAIVHARVAGSELLLRASGKPNVQIGQPATVSIDAADMRFFDQSSGKALP